MNAQQILASGHAILFPTSTPAAVKSRYKELAMIWHPDRCDDPQAADVLSHLTAMRDRALNGPQQSSIAFAKKGGGQISFAYIRRRRWEAGEIFVTNSAVVYRVDPAFRDLVHASSQHRWTFPSDKFRDEMTKFLPNEVRMTELETDGTLMIYRRNADQVLMADLLDQESAGVPPVHAMWFVSALLNICSYFYISEITHFGLLPEVLLVSTEKHSVAVTGPCLYLTKFMSRPSAVPAEVLAAWPSLRDRKKPVPHFVADLSSVRSIGMRAMGIHDRATLRNRADVAEGFKRWLLSAPLPNSIKDYEAWEQLRGTRRFTPYELTAQQIYES
jgi:hypothetical protein